MKKHIIGIIAVILVLVLSGGGIWLYVRNRNASNLYELSTNFVYSQSTNNLTTCMTSAESLYRSKVSSSENRITNLQAIIVKLNKFEKDLITYLSLSNTKASKTKSLNKTYQSLSRTRNRLITDYNEYITRMQGNINIDGTAVRNLYNELFNKTVNFVYDYNSCFNSTSSYVFGKVYTVDTIKAELYELYSGGVSDLLNHISNNQFYSTDFIARLNKGIKLDNNNLCVKTSVDGGEFSVNALNFKKYFINSNLDTLVTNFEIYYYATINPTTETSNEKLTVYYAKQILEI